MYFFLFIPFSAQFIYSHKMTVECCDLNIYVCFHQNEFETFYSDERANCSVSIMTTLISPASWRWRNSSDRQSIFFSIHLNSMHSERININQHSAAYGIVSLLFHHQKQFRTIGSSFLPSLYFWLQVGTGIYLLMYILFTFFHIFCIIRCHFPSSEFQSTDVALIRYHQIISIIIDSL
jgi:hypothetical protein